MSAFCPECDQEIDIDAADAEVGDELSCSECGSLLRVSNDSPLELEFADDDDDDDDDDEKEEKEDDDFDDADDDEEEKDDED
jgi:DNA-directed RNA polymerase subunit M/transcription elongation factor TFIIS